MSLVKWRKLTEDNLYPGYYLHLEMRRHSDQSMSMLRGPYWTLTAVEKDLNYFRKQEGFLSGYMYTQYAKSYK